MPRIFFVTHPEVAIDPARPVPLWPLSTVGRERTRRFAERLLGQCVETVYSSIEQKALDCAEIMSEVLRVPTKSESELGENDRSSTGYIAPPEFWEVVTQFFARPDESVRGWETARAAQARIVAAVTRIASEHRKANSLVIISHGGVGALLMAHLQHRTIGTEDRPAHPGGGCLITTTGLPPVLTSGWKTIEQWTA